MEEDGSDDGSGTGSDDEGASDQEQSEDEERHALWDPSTATPARRQGSLKARRQLVTGEEQQQQQQGQKRQGQGRRRRSSTVSGGSQLLAEEQPVLNHLNEQRRRQGKEAVARPTVSSVAEAIAIVLHLLGCTPPCLSPAWLALSFTGTWAHCISFSSACLL